MLIPRFVFIDINITGELKIFQTLCISCILLAIILLWQSTTQRCQKERSEFSWRAYVSCNQTSRVVAHHESSPQSSRESAESGQTGELFFSRDFNHYQREAGATEAEWISHRAIDKASCLRGERFRGKNWRLHRTGKNRSIPLFRELYAVYDLFFLPFFLPLPFRSFWFDDQNKSFETWWGCRFRYNCIIEISFWHMIRTSEKIFYKRSSKVLILHQIFLFFCVNF